ncbi:SOS response-associated peptidase family protein [Hyunsoonleella sp. 2307UL5-6]|uniref:SOS response-associated peptidase family protein n=1 Tax=Hyunsoonleella sp. 2307UL5-6 TaxID=3384768 RepID=UPI0039BD815A
MYYKLSNIATIEDMELVFDMPLKYPHIYQKNPLINGLKEELLPVITADNTQEIQFGIWGILPQGYKEDWSVYQKTQNTLNFNINELEYSDKFSLEKRCVIIVTGFFLTYLSKGEIYPFYAYPKSKTPFAIAGVYNTTYDGYITVSLILTNISKKASKYHNISKRIPLIISGDNYNNWLSSNYNDIIENPNQEFDALNFQCHPIAREFYKNSILFESFLDPSDYESLAIPL